MAISNLSLFGGAFFTPVIVGKMTSTLGWQWTFWFIAIFAGAMLPLVILFCPETTYVRPDYLNAGIAQPRETDANGDHEMGEYATGGLEGNAHNDHPEKNPFGHNSSIHTLNPHPTAFSSHDNQKSQRVSYTRSLLPFNGRKTDENFFKLLLRPFPLFLNPGILWACLIQGLLIGWTVLIGIVLAAIMLLPPLSFDEVKTGYMYTGAFIGAILGFALAGVLADSSAKWLAKRNNGIYEPEFRLILVIPQLIFGCAGLYGFGIVASDVRKYGWFWPDFFFALEVMGMVLGAVASALYVVDAHRDVSVEAFTCLLVFKNVFSFGLTYSGLHWLAKGGVKGPFIAVASVQVAVCCTTVLICESFVSLKHCSAFAESSG